MPSFNANVNIANITSMHYADINSAIKLTFTAHAVKQMFYQLTLGHPKEMGLKSHSTRNTANYQLLSV